MRKKKKKIDLTPFESREALCPHFGLCGGCSHQKIAYEKQLELKRDEVKALIDNALKSVAGSDGAEAEYIFEGILESPSETGYRNKMEFTFGDECKGGPFALGLHQKGSFLNIVNITDCALVDEDVNKIRNAVKDFFNAYYEKGLISFHNKFSHKGWLRHLLIRKAAKTGEIMVALVTDSDITGGTDELRQRLEDEVAVADGVAKPERAPEKTAADDTADAKLNEADVLNEFAEIVKGLELSGEVKSIIHIVNDSLSDAVKSDSLEVMYGSDCIEDEILGLRFKISVFSFFQTNTFGAEVLYKKAMDYAKESKGVLFDLYSGTGTITQLMSRAVERAVGVEIVAEAVEAARENARLNDIDNVEFIAEDVLTAVDRLGVPDALILDPPRDGVNPKALGKILSWGVEKIVYISCKPQSLARDLPSFIIAGYGLEKMCCVDMFPQTGHVETVVLLSKGEMSTKKIRVEFPLEEMDMSGFQQRATYEEIKKYVLDQYSIKVSSLYIAQIKRKCGLEMGENYNLPKDENQRVPQCSPEKEKAIMEALRHFNMIR